MHKPIEYWNVGSEFSNWIDSISKQVQYTYEQVESTPRNHLVHWVAFLCDFKIQNHCQQLQNYVFDNASNPRFMYHEYYTKEKFAEYLDKIQELNNTSESIKENARQYLENIPSPVITYYNLLETIKNIQDTFVELNNIDISDETPLTEIIADITDWGSRNLPILANRIQKLSHASAEIQELIAPLINQVQNRLNQAYAMQAQAQDFRENFTEVNQGKLEKLFNNQTDMPQYISRSIALSSNVCRELVEFVSEGDFVIDFDPESVVIEKQEKKLRKEFEKIQNNPDIKNSQAIQSLIVILNRLRKESIDILRDVKDKSPTIQKNIAQRLWQLENQMLGELHAEVELLELNLGLSPGTLIKPFQENSQKHFQEFKDKINALSSNLHKSSKDAHDFLKRPVTNVMSTTIIEIGRKLYSWVQEVVILLTGQKNRQQPISPLENNIKMPQPIEYTLQEINDRASPTQDFKTIVYRKDEKGLLFRAIRPDNKQTVEATIPLEKLPKDESKLASFIVKYATDNALLPKNYTQIVDESRFKRYQQAQQEEQHYKTLEDDVQVFFRLLESSPIDGSVRNIESLSAEKKEELKSAYMVIQPYIARKYPQFDINFVQTMNLDPVQASENITKIEGYLPQWAGNFPIFNFLSTTLNRLTSTVQNIKENILSQENLNNMLRSEEEILLDLKQHQANAVEKKNLVVNMFANEGRDLKLFLTSDTQEFSTENNNIAQQNKPLVAKGSEFENQTLFGKIKTLKYSEKIAEVEKKLHSQIKSSLANPENLFAPSLGPPYTMLHHDADHVKAYKKLLNSVNNLKNCLSRLEKAANFEDLTLFEMPGKVVTGYQFVLPILSNGITAYFNLLDAMQEVNPTLMPILAEGEDYLKSMREFLPFLEQYSLENYIKREENILSKVDSFNTWCQLQNLYIQKRHGYKIQTEPTPETPLTSILEKSGGESKKSSIISPSRQSSPLIMVQKIRKARDELQTMHANLNNPSSKNTNANVSADTNSSPNFNETIRAIDKFFNDVKRHYRGDNESVLAIETLRDFVVEEKLSVSYIQKFNNLGQTLNFLTNLEKIAKKIYADHEEELGDTLQKIHDIIGYKLLIHADHFELKGGLAPGTISTPVLEKLDNFLNATLDASINQDIPILIKNFNNNFALLEQRKVNQQAVHNELLQQKETILEHMAVEENEMRKALDVLNKLSEKHSFSSTLNWTKREKFSKEFEKDFKEFLKQYDILYPALSINPAFNRSSFLYNLHPPKTVKAGIDAILAQKELVSAYCQGQKEKSSQLINIQNMIISHTNSQQVAKRSQQFILRLLHKLSQKDHCVHKVDKIANDTLLEKITIDNPEVIKLASKLNNTDPKTLEKDLVAFLHKQKQQLDPTYWPIKLRDTYEELKKLEQEIGKNLATAINAGSGNFAAKKAQAEYNSKLNEFKNNLLKYLDNPIKWHTKTDSSVNQSHQTNIPTTVKENKENKDIINDDNYDNQSTRGLRR